MKKCIAIPLENGNLSPHFGHCEQFAIVTVEDEMIKDIKELTPPEHIPGLYPKWVASFDVTDVIAGGMGERAIMLFNEQGINAFVGAPIKNARALVEDFLSNKLVLNANYCNHDENTQHNCSH